jgi:hypothetical protein
MAVTIADARLGESAPSLFSRDCTSPPPTYRIAMKSRSSYSSASKTGMMFG